MSKQQPPRVFTRLLEWFCHDSFFEELQGDLEEKFDQHRETHGLRYAQRTYALEVIKLFRPSVMGSFKVKTQNNQFAMLKNYSLIAFRSLMRHKLFASINLIGLSVSMAVGLLAIAFVSEMYSYDNFHENSDRIYRVVNDRTPVNRETDAYATTAIITGRRLASDFAGFEAIAPIFNRLRGELSTKDKTIPVKGIYTDTGFFDVLTFPLLYGDPRNALEAPYSIILTESTALKLFGKVNVVGETLEYAEDQLVVTGIAADPPRNSHIQFEAIAPLKTLDVKQSNVVKNWGAMWSSYVYVLLPKEHDKSQIQALLDQLAMEENTKVSSFSIDLSLEALNDIFPGNGRYNQMNTIMPERNVKSIVVLALIVVLSACFNYTNLSIARSLKRGKEVGVRKVVGASRWQLIVQFVLEAIMVAFLALFIAFFLFRLIRPEFISLNRFIQQTTMLELTPSIYLNFFLFTVLIGILAGIVPSLLLAKFKTVAVLKGMLSLKVRRGLNLRKLLVGLQFALSMGFAILVTLANKQYQYALNFDLGFDTENVLNVDIGNGNLDLLQNAYAQVPAVQEMSTASFMPSLGISNSDYAKFKDPNDSVQVYTIDISPNYLNTLNHELLAGDDFIEGQSADKIIVNELLTRKMGMDGPQSALGEQIEYFGKKWTIIGVVPDFHHGTINNKVEAFAFTSGRQRHFNLNLSIRSDDIVSTLSQLEQSWSDIHPDIAFEASFYSEEIEATYATISSSTKTYGLLAIVAVSISILGLLGMAVYTTESKMKELTIRKVLGASAAHLVMLLSRNFMLIFLLAATATIPLAYLFYKKTIVRYAVYKIDVGFLELSGGAIVILIMAFLTIGLQTLKAARANPTRALRND